MDLIRVGVAYIGVVLDVVSEFWAVDAIRNHVLRKIATQCVCITV
jgi:hypothetical protein